MRAEVVDDMNLTNATQWSFTMAAPPGRPTTARLRGLGHHAEIRANITDNGGVPTVAMKVDGATVPAAFSSSTGLVSYTPTVPLSTTRHTL